MKKIMISVAPVAATDILINPRAIARDVYECYKNGASMVHLHCRDLNGNLTPDLSLLEETVAYIREMHDIVVEISTGGVSNLTIEERVQPCYPSWVEANSLNVGSVNLGTSVYQNPIKDVEYCVKTIMDNKKIPETEVFELGMINTVRELNEEVSNALNHHTFLSSFLTAQRRDLEHGAHLVGSHGHHALGLYDVRHLCDQRCVVVHMDTRRDHVRILKADATRWKRPYPAQS